MKSQKQLTPEKKRRRVLLAGLLVLMMAAPFLVSGYVCARTANRIVPIEQAAALDADCVLVLGALVRENGQLSGILEDRMIVGIDAYKRGASDRLLVSGDHGQADYDEVNAMKAYAVGQGVPTGDVFMDHAGFSTYESLYRARDVFGAKKIVIVTQRYHLYRALYIADRLGLEAYGVASNLRTYAGQLKFSLREILARDKDFVQTMFLPKPTYLGEPIPLTGDGSSTDG